MKDLSIVVLVGTATDPASLLRSISDGRALDEILAVPDRHTVVSVIAMWAPDEPIPGVAEILSLEDEPQTRRESILSATGVYALSRTLGKSRVGRVLASLSPTDPSRVFRRTVRANATATDLLATADVLIAADLPSVLTAWSALHAGSTRRAFHTIAAAARELAAG